jgi:hypothetical protein
MPEAYPVAGLSEIFLSAGAVGAGGGSFIGTYDASQMLDGVDTLIRMTFQIPYSIIHVGSVKIMVVAVGTGDLRRSVTTEFARPCGAEHYDNHTDSIAASQVAVTINHIMCLDITAALTGITAGDMVGLEFTRHASNVLDTINATVYFLGILIKRTP